MRLAQASRGVRYRTIYIYIYIHRAVRIAAALQHVRVCVAVVTRLCDINIAPWLRLLMDKVGGDCQ